jgi:hypothetical protein
MTALDLAVKARLLTIFLGLVVLFSLFEKAVRRVVMRGVVLVLGRDRSGFRRVRLGSVAVA